MRAVIVVVVALAGCHKATDAEVKRYVNTDMLEHLTRLQDALHAVGDLRAEDVGAPGVMKNLVHAGTVLRAVRDGASKVTPPKKLATLHADLLSIVNDFKGAVDDMAVASAGGDGSKFAEGHAKLMDTMENYTRWEHRFDEDLSQAHVTVAKLPDLPPLPDDPSLAPPPAPAKPASPCGPDPCPCAPGSEVKNNGIVVECDFTADVGLSGILCSAGKATFNEDDGQLASCITEVAWALPYETPVPPENVVTCGPGRVSRNKAGDVSSCTLLGSVKVGDTTLDKGTVVTIEKLAVTSATPPGGTKQCFDPAGKTVPCS